jgi:hypothetical protein
MIKVFNNTQEYNTYTQGGLVAGDLYYVLENGSVHFRTNNIDGEDKVYDKADEGSSEPEYTTLNLNTLTVNSGGKNFSTIIPATVGQTIEVYNPNHLVFAVGQGQPNLNPATGDIDGYIISQNGIAPYNYNDDNYLEHLYTQNAPNNFEGSYSEYGFCITYTNNTGTPIDGLIYYRIF